MPPRERPRPITRPEVWISWLVQADVMLDDDPVEIRRHAQQHLADDVHWMEMTRIDRPRAAGTSGEEHVLVALIEQELHREPSFRLRRRACLRQRAGQRQLALSLRPDDRVDLCLDDAGRI